MRIPAVADAAQGVDHLRAASERINGANPVEALELVDCDPPAVRTRAQEALKAARLVGEAADIAHRAVSGALQGWRGPAADAFARAGGDTVDNLRQTRQRTQDTGEAGLGIADRLDEITQETSRRSTAIAQAVDGACDVVLRSDPADPNFVPAAQAVNGAVNDVITVCEKDVTEVGHLGAVLDGLA
ncbi:hypothetical protein [Streptoalloteichus hindustanus]|uniref:Uncharacterized protein n=1 Tax=Streptoalloteichus hindustanus TaxID=2017 RepID=A0A1M4U521_STRHI|nr:hypothetical protein [Streptoalloteichus hindustanus]SHE51637.1 hypothetical protein SAMN05444320_101297 [Streptoalloteichus hindustanus]